MDSMNFSISEFAEAMHGYYLDNDITILKIDSSNNKLLGSVIEEHFLVRTRDKHAFCFFVLTGEITVALDYKTYTAKTNNMLSFSPFNVITRLHISPDFSGYILIFHKDVIEEIGVTRKPPVSISQLLTADKTPLKEVSAAEMEIMTICLKRIYHYLEHKGHRLRKELILNTFYTFILEVINIIFNTSTQSTSVEISVKMTYVKKFIELLAKYADKEHSPAFYADKLCISVQYLSLILKEISGHTANIWIAHYLTTRAKTLLRKPDLTIQHITETLNFSDQSSFGKFFKKHMGISPKKYRESHMTY